MSIRNFNPVERTKLKELMTESISVMNEVEVLTGGLNDTISAIAEELEIKPSILKKAIKIAQKNNFEQSREDIDIIESILQSTGKLHNPEE